ncbi:hypothetical protein BpHYR1_008728 [Brachionus plicatilis]|uniref:Uncharacterized protein n=1 Tax=Brachionus plicatilis TaxID=10195 RepID=A0A3M7SQK8_BRAPC|nr:hypothetical protein BpHYR1_008728 [Brachionus plicatilis]
MSSYMRQITKNCDQREFFFSNRISGIFCYHSPQETSFPVAFQVFVVLRLNIEFIYLFIYSINANSGDLFKKRKKKLFKTIKKRQNYTLVEFDLIYVDKTSSQKKKSFLLNLYLNFAKSHN